jgi:hypothetical protein
MRLTDGAAASAENLREVERFASRILGPFRPYTPTWTATTTNPTIGNGSLDGEWREFGDLVWLRIEMTAGSTTTFGSGFYGFSLPFRAHGSRKQAITGLIHSATATRRWTIEGYIPANNLTIDRVHYDGGSLTGTAPVALASGDSIVMQGFYVPK